MSAQKPQRIATVFVSDPDALEVAPSPADVPAGGRRGALLGVALLVGAVAAAAVPIVLSKALRLDALTATLLQLVGALILIVGLLLLVPVLRAHRSASRWNAAYLELAAAPILVTARIVEIDLDWRGARCTVSGRVRYGEPGAEEHEVELGGGSLQPLTWILSRDEAPSIGSRTVVWRTPDHSVVLIRVHADGTGG